jgi:hypothetical protein
VSLHVRGSRLLLEPVSGKYSTNTSNRLPFLECDRKHAVKFNLPRPVLYLFWIGSLRTKCGIEGCERRREDYRSGGVVELPRGISSKYELVVYKISHTL